LLKVVLAGPGFSSSRVFTSRTSHAPYPLHRACFSLLTPRGHLPLDPREILINLAPACLSHPRRPVIVVQFALRLLGLLVLGQKLWVGLAAVRGRDMLRSCWVGADMSCGSLARIVFVRVSDLSNLLGLQFTADSHFIAMIVQHLRACVDFSSLIVNRIVPPSCTSLVANCMLLHPALLLLLLLLLAAFTSLL